MSVTHVETCRPPGNSQCAPLPGTHAPLSACFVRASRHTERTLYSMIAIIATVHAATDSLGSLREMVTELDLFAVADDTALIDGAHVLHEPTGCGVGDTAGSLRIFVKTLEAEPDELVINDAHLVALDLEPHRIGLIECGAHIKELPSNILVEVHPSCKTC